MKLKKIPGTTQFYIDENTMRKILAMRNELELNCLDVNFIIDTNPVTLESELHIKIMQNETKGISIDLAEDK